MTTSYRITTDAIGQKIEVNKIEYKVSLARTGGQGAANTVLGGLPLEFTDPSEGDLITVSADSKWVNVARSNVTDGGNF